MTFQQKCQKWCHSQRNIKSGAIEKYQKRWHSKWYIKSDDIPKEISKVMPFKKKYQGWWHSQRNIKSDANPKEMSKVVTFLKKCLLLESEVGMEEKVRGNSFCSPSIRFQGSITINLILLSNELKVERREETVFKEGWKGSPWFAHTSSIPGQFRCNESGKYSLRNQRNRVYEIRKILVSKYEKYRFKIREIKLTESWKRFPMDHTHQQHTRSIHMQWIREIHLAKSEKYFFQNRRNADSKSEW